MRAEKSLNKSDKILKHPDQNHDSATSLQRLYRFQIPIKVTFGCTYSDKLKERLTENVCKIFKGSHFFPDVHKQTNDFMVMESKRCQFASHVMVAPKSQA